MVFLLTGTHAVANENKFSTHDKANSLFMMLMCGSLVRNKWVALISQVLIALQPLSNLYTVFSYSRQVQKYRAKLEQVMFRPEYEQAPKEAWDMQLMCESMLCNINERDGLKKCNFLSCDGKKKPKFGNAD